MSTPEDPTHPTLSFGQRLQQDLKNDLIAGLLVLIPLATTIWLTVTVALWVIDFLTSIPKQLNPFNDLNPLLISLLNLLTGLAVPLLSILLIGLMARNIAGRWLLDFGERTLKAIPLAGSVYTTLKQLLETVLGSSSKFRRVVLVEYPRAGIWAVAFVTGAVAPDFEQGLVQQGLVQQGLVQQGLVQQGLVQQGLALQGLGVQNPEPAALLSLFIPTTPNPTTGWYAIVPETQVVNTAMSVEDAFKVLISGGIVTPGPGAIAPGESLASLPPVGSGSGNN